MIVKLTNPQRELLVDIFDGNHACVEEYKPARRLVDLGLAEFRFPGRLYPTDVGRALLAQERTDGR